MLRISGGKDMNGKGLNGALLAFWARVLRLEVGSNGRGALQRWVPESLLRLIVPASRWRDLRRRGSTKVFFFLASVPVVGE